MLASEFLEPLGLSIEGLERAIDADAGRLKAVMVGSASIAADLDLRLARYF